MKPLVFLCVLAAGCASGAVEVEGEVATSGEVDLEWAIFDGGQIVSCVDAGASEVRLLFHPLDDAAEQMEVLECYAGIGVTGAIAPGDYDVELRLMSPAGGVIDAVEVHDLSVSGGRTTPLGAIAFSM